MLGEAGIGKSRLLSEFRASVLASGARVLVGRSYESTRIVPLGPWLDALRRGGAIEESTLVGLDAVWRRELARLFPELGDAGRDASTSDDRGALFEAIARLVEHLARTLVVIVEDAHARTFAEYAAHVGEGLDDVALQATAALYSGFAWHNAGEFTKAIETHARALTLLEGAPLRRRDSHHSFPLPSPDDPNRRASASSAR